MTEKEWNEWLKTIPSGKRKQLRKLLKVVRTTTHFPIAKAQQMVFKSFTK